MKIIDPHVHCRDGVQYKKDTIKRTSYFAGRSGVSAIFDMPNTSPPIISRKQVEERLELAKHTCSPEVSYGLYIGVTSDLEQIREAVKCYNELSLREDRKVGVVGLKMFAGHSVGDLAIIDGDKQKRVYNILGKCKYDGVLVVHCEKERFMKPKLWDPNFPASHSMARPLIAECESVRDQISFLPNSNFKGTLHIAHISTTESVDYIDYVRQEYGMKISCGATPHHLFLNYDMMPELERENKINSLLWKVNPPLRSKEEQGMLLGRLKNGKINWIETDHANHEFDEKINEPYLSGIPGLNSWPNVITRLKKEGFSDDRIEELTGRNVLKVYRLSEDIVGSGDVEEDLSMKEYEYGYKEFI